MVVCVLAIIGNTIRLAVANRRREIEVLKLCGATDGYVRSPFLVEGALQAVAAATLALLLLLIAYLCLRGHVESHAERGDRRASTVFLDPLTMLAIVLGGGHGRRARQRAVAAPLPARCSDADADPNVQHARADDHAFARAGCAPARVAAPAALPARGRARPVRGQHRRRDRRRCSTTIEASSARQERIEREAAELSGQRKTDAGRDCADRYARSIA